MNVGIWVYIKDHANLLYTITYWCAGWIGVMFANKLMRPVELKSFKSMKRLDRFKTSLQAPTLLGILFILLIFAAARLSLLKDSNQIESGKSDKKDITDAVTKAKQENTETLTRAFGIATSQILLASNNSTALLKHTIDSLQNKIDSLTNGNVLVRPDDKFVLVDSGTNGQRISLRICNNGNIPVKSVDIDVRLVLISDLDHAEKYAILHHTFSAHDCWDFHAYTPPYAFGTFYFIYKISYSDRYGKKVTDYYTIGYSEQLHTWAENISRFGYLFLKDP